MNRREVLKAGACAALGTMVSPLVVQATEPKIRLKSSGYPFEHLKPLLTGKVQVEGAEVEFVPGQIGNINTQVFTGATDLDFTEIGLVPFLLATANDDFDAFRLLPVFPLRMFRHKSIFVHADAGIRLPEDLKGRRVATPGYSSTSLTWIRGILQDD